MGRRAAVWLGRDADTNRQLAQPLVPGLDAVALAELTAAPRRYGFHATMMAPFHLAPAVQLNDLTRALGGLADRLVPQPMPPLRVSRFSDFLALMPEQESPELLALAAVCVSALDPFRAALSEEDLRRRRKPGLSDVEMRLLDRWGYPYVMEAFRFHMTLTGQLGEPDAALLSAFLDGYLAAALQETLMLGALSLFEQPERQKSFRRIANFPLRGPRVETAFPRRGASDAA